MRYKLLLFVLLSLLLHILLLSLLDLKTPPEKKKEPVTVTVIPKKKEVPKPQERPADKKPPEVIENTPLNEDLETRMDQMSPVPQGGADKKEQKKAEKPSVEQKNDEDKTSIDSMNAARAPVDIPKIAPDDKLTEKQKEDILNPKDIIEKYAREGADMKGQDHVSMQYIKFKYQSYFYKFARRLYQVWIYPREAAYRGEDGIVEISFVISRDGMISGIKVIRSSGYPDLDREAVNALKKTAGVPLPESYELDFLRVDAYFQYVLGNGFLVY